MYYLQTRDQMEEEMKALSNQCGCEVAFSRKEL